jgi:hypothetical protein
MGLYLGWNDAGHVPGSTGLGVYTFLVAVVLGLIAWRGFDRLHRDIQAQASGSPMSGRDSGSAQR